MSEEDLDDEEYCAGTSSLSLYLNELNRTPLLSRKEEGELALRIKAGDQGALNKLVQANLRFVVSIARLYSHQGVPLEDLISEGNIGLIEAAKRFDHSLGFKFVTYAVWWIRQVMRRMISDQSRIVRIPSSRAGVLYRVNKATIRLENELERSPTEEEVALELDMSEDEVRSTAGIGYSHVSLNWRSRVNGHDEDELQDLIPDRKTRPPDEEAYRGALSSDIVKAMESLKPFERTILVAYFGLDGGIPQTLEEIGRKYNLTRERIRQIKKQSLDRLKRKRSQYLIGYHDDE